MRRRAGGSAQRGLKALAKIYCTLASGGCGSYFIAQFKAATILANALSALAAIQLRRAGLSRAFVNICSGRCPL
jgi:hypothetical protein